MRPTLTIAVIVLCCSPAAADWPTETEWAKRDVNGCRYVQSADDVEVTLYDNTRCDDVSKTHANEIDWAKSGKHFEAVGQALYYAIVTQTKPGIILLVKDREADMKFVYRTQTVCAKHDIRLWVEFVDEEYGAAIVLRAR